VKTVDKSLNQQLQGLYEHGHDHDGPVDLTGASEDEVKVVISQAP
jgi:hypothetical protein